MPAIATAFAQGTHAARPAASSANNGWQYFETDTNGGTLFQSNGSTWVQIGAPINALTSPMTTKGDLIVGGTSGASNRLGVGTDTYVLTADSTQTLGVKWATAAAATLTTASGYLTGDVTMTTHGTFYDGPSVSLAAGTWLVVAQATVHLAGANSNVVGKLWDGTTVASSTEAVGLANGDLIVSISGLVSPGSTTTYKVSVTGVGTDSNTIKATQTDSTTGCTNKASFILGVKVA